MDGDDRQQEPRHTELSPVERRVARALADSPVQGRPLSRRARQTQRSVETYLASGVLPRYMQRLREIEDALAVERSRLQRAYRALRDRCGDDAELFERRWRASASRWPFEHVNELIRQHNEWYPVEAGLPLDPRTGDYVTIGGRSYRRPEVGAEWVLERFPAADPSLDRA